MGKTKKTNALLLIGLIGIFVFGTHFSIFYGKAMFGNKDMWWTPLSLSLSLDETKNDFRLLISGRTLQQHLQEETLFVDDPQDTTYKIVPEDIRVRLNNWNKVKASFLNSSVYAAFMLGISLACLIMGIAGYFKRKPSKENS